MQFVGRQFGAVVEICGPAGDQQRGPRLQSLRRIVRALEVAVDPGAADVGATSATNRVDVVAVGRQFAVGLDRDLDQVQRLAARNRFSRSVATAVGICLTRLRPRSRRGDSASTAPAIW